jgi:NAD(P)-dependent dehydrogenase (short-subunit alcohol dehydrogenase family)
MPKPWPKRIGGAAAVGDVAEEAALAAAVEQAVALGPLRIAVACAGIAPAARIAGGRGPHDLTLFRAGYPGEPDRQLQPAAAGRSAR